MARDGVGREPAALGRSSMVECADMERRVEKRAHVASSGRSRSIETVVVGAGQAGLLMSWHLRRAGREHVVLDRRATLGGGWQDRWDAFRLVGPNWTVSLPGLDYQGDDPDEFMPRDELVAHFRRYAAAIDAPVQLETEVERLEAIDGPGSGRGSARGSARFRVSTNRGPLEARNVIVAGGPFQTPRIPGVGAGLAPEILSLHSHHYRNPAALPPGRVLVVGSGQTGVQLAEELIEAGREVILAVGRCWSAPRRYRGRDIFWWLRTLATDGRRVGASLPTADRLPSPAARFACTPQLSGHGGGHTVDLRRMAADGGVRLVGRFEGVDGTAARFRADLAESLRLGEAGFDLRLRPICDAYVAATAGDFPAHEPETVSFEPPEVTGLDLAAEGVSTVLWSSGYRPAFDWIRLPVLDDFGLPIQADGSTAIDGLSFIGTPWLVDMGSANLVGLARDAEALAARW
jgi:putative flavoprotein involved in K+ transport